MIPAAALPIIRQHLNSQRQAQRACMAAGYRLTIPQVKHAIAKERKLKERPILFSAPMVLALLDGTKTQTRRVVKWKGVAPGLNLGFSGLQAYKGCNAWFLSSKGAGGAWNDRSDATECPYGQPGDRLWVRETWAYGIHAMAASRDEDGPFVYAADNFGTQGRLCDRWRPSIHMPRAASRIALEVTGVRVERLQAISRGDAMAEGCPFQNMAAGPDPRKWYAELWDQINGPGAWGLNPWVWAVEFRRA